MRNYTITVYCTREEYKIIKDYSKAVKSDMSTELREALLTNLKILENIVDDL